MESDLGKLFIGGISWDTDENRLKEYFEQYGQVMEVVIMRDRITGRARGFGFIVFADPSVAERVVMDKHMIDGRTVEAKKAVPRDDQQILSRKSNSNQGSPGMGRTKKIFVGGLASTVMESDFKNYFDQFGTIADVVVMYDHNTQRPRGFGFITFDSEEAVDRVLHKTFHELNGKMVEVKRAVPKELTPSPSRSPVVGYNYNNFNRPNNLINSFPQGYNLNSVGGYNRMNPLITGRSGLSPFANPRYGMGMGMDMEPGLGGGYGLSSPLNKNQGYGRVMGPYYDGNSNRFNMPIGYNVRGESLVSPIARNLWGNGSIGNPTNPGNPNAFLGSPSGNFRTSFRDRGAGWGTTSAIPQVGDNASGYNNSGNFGYGFDDGNHGLGNGGYGRTQIIDRVPEPLAASSGAFDSTYGDLNRGGSAYLDSSWGSRSTELDGAGSFGFGLGTSVVDVASKTPESYIGSYSINNRPSIRGIAA